MAKELIGLLGGTFDPVHNGHILLAQQAYAALNLTHLQFIPNNQPVDRAVPHASAQDRLAMLTCAVTNYPYFKVNPIEIQRGGPSYTIDTLIQLRKQNSTQIFCLLIGCDVFTKLDQWKNWQRLFEYTHLVIINRPNYSLPNIPWLNELIEMRQITDPAHLHSHNAGLIYFLEITPNPMTATHIRKQFAQGKHPTKQLPTEVMHYIQHHHLYETPIK